MENGVPIPPTPSSPDAFEEDLDGPTLDLSEIVLATGNPHKVEEMRAIFERELGERVDVRSLADFPGGGFVEPVEDGTTFEANATIKAVSYAEQTGRLCLADDSGLEVDALGGAPGVISSHYFCDGRPDDIQAEMSRDERDAANNERLMHELERVTTEARTARFVCVMVLAAPPEGEHLGRPIARVRGTFEGRIGLPGDVPRGANGFGYDPLFLVGPGFERTSAELIPAEKNRLSHRGRAAELMTSRVKALVGI